ncbi:MAG: class I SAM-dependent methyltransferase [Candidatus Bathyarchaeota archaeon]|nr:class I SAM-dependent methyltransferase [Candidatus Bathyarchaeota archaeon]
MNLRKSYMYFNSRTLRYVIKHPLRFIVSMRSLFNKVDYINFVSELTGIPKELMTRLMPSKETKNLIVEGFRRSIAPPNDESPLSFEEALSLYLIVRAIKPKIVLETGVSAGRSSTFILAALYDNMKYDNMKGVLYSIDPNPNSGYAIPEKLKDKWRFINTTSEGALPNLLEELNQIDIFLHDSLHTYECMIFEYKSVWPFIRKGGFLLSDDVDQNLAFRDFCQNISKDAIIVYLSGNFAGCKKC